MPPDKTRLSQASTYPPKHVVASHADCRAHLHLGALSRRSHIDLLNMHVLVDVCPPVPGTQANESLSRVQQDAEDRALSDQRLRMVLEVANQTLSCRLHDLNSLMVEREVQFGKEKADFLERSWLLRAACIHFSRQRLHVFRIHVSRQRLLRVACIHVCRQRPLRMTRCCRFVRLSVARYEAERAYWQRLATDHDHHDLRTLTWRSHKTLKVVAERDSALSRVSELESHLCTLTEHLQDLNGDDSEASILLRQIETSDGFHSLESDPCSDASEWAVVLAPAHSPARDMKQDALSQSPLLSALDLTEMGQVADLESRVAELRRKEEEEGGEEGEAEQDGHGCSRPGAEGALQQGEETVPVKEEEAEQMTSRRLESVAQLEWLVEALRRKEGASGEEQEEPVSRDEQEISDATTPGFIKTITPTQLESRVDALRQVGDETRYSVASRNRDPR
jgi:hypothetical protein